MYVICISQGGHSSNPAVSAGEDPGAGSRFQMRVNSVGATGGRGLQSVTPTSRLPMDHAGGEMMAGNNPMVPDYTGRTHGHTPPMDPQATSRLMAEFVPHCKLFEFGLRESKISGSTAGYKA